MLLGENEGKKAEDIKRTTLKPELILCDTGSVLLCLCESPLLSDLFSI